ncbi:MAG: chromosomal replication initiator protein DnaA [Oscillospiraceae bacterium]|nr:chromosomal replication initiator protein DnaA [Oscillospiraceae bacterium]
MYSKAYIWSRVLSYLETNYPTAVAIYMLDDAEVIEITDRKLVLYSPSTYRKEMILDRFSDKILEAMREQFQSDVELIVLDEEELPKYTGEKTKRRFVDFNSHFTFDSFVVGPSNEHAYSAALAVAEERGKAYNPLFLYGQSGLGKTHLLYAIANRIQQKHPDFNIVYIHSDQFTNEFIEAVRSGKNFEFREKYRNADLLLIDDIQFITGKEGTQIEFFHTFNTLFESKRQIVMTSDRPPSDLAKLEERLRTRFEWGLIVDVQPPNYETRVAITKNKAQSLAIDLPDDVCDFIAEKLTNNVRQIEGTIKKIKAYHDLDKFPLDISHISKIIQDLFKTRTDGVATPELIISEVCRFYSIEERMIRGTQKTKGITEARQLAMYLIRSMTSLSTPDIAKEFGKNHTTVLHSIRTIEDKLKSPSSGLHDNIRDIQSNVNSRL